MQAEPLPSVSAPSLPCLADVSMDLSCSLSLVARSTRCKRCVSLREIWFMSVERNWGIEILEASFLVLGPLLQQSPGFWACCAFASIFWGGGQA